MKRVISFLAAVVLVFSVFSMAAASPMGDFQGQIYQLYGTNKLEAVVEKDFFLTPHVGHCNTFRKQAKESDWKSMMSNPETLSQLAAIMACEMRFLKANYGNDFAEKFFGEKKMVVDLTKPVYVGLTGNVFSVYLTCEDCGCYILYAPLLNRVHMTTISLEKAERMEEALFQRCADGYMKIDSELLVQPYATYEAEFKKNTDLQKLAF